MVGVIPAHMPLAFSGFSRNGLDPGIGLLLKLDLFDPLFF
jgi:hypothetical protein